MFAALSETLCSSEKLCLDRKVERFIRVPVDSNAPASVSLPYFNDWNTGVNPLTRNCFAFACNRLEPDTSSLSPGVYRVAIPPPGLTSGTNIKMLTPDELRRALVADGLIYVPERVQDAITLRSGHYLVAAYIDPTRCSNEGDYHFYRRHEESGVWYHKPGWKSPVTNQDISKKIINDPQVAERDGYNKFAGFYWAPEAGLRLEIDVRHMSGPRQILSVLGL